MISLTVVGAVGLGHLLQGGSVLSLGLGFRRTFLIAVLFLYAFKLF